MLREPLEQLGQAHAQGPGLPATSPTPALLGLAALLVPAVPVAKDDHRQLRLMVTFNGETKQLFFLIQV